MPIVSVGTGGVHACVVSADGAVWCAGGNQWGYLGDNTTNDSAVPIRVKGIPKAVQVDGGGNSTCVVTTNQAIVCFGDNRFGLMGIGNFELDQASNRTPVHGIATARQISVSGAHACALLERGTVRCWGWNAYGQLGKGERVDATDPDATQGVALPVEVKGLRDAVEVGAGAGHSCARLVDGTVWCWGSNENGQLGNGTKVSSAVPVRVRNITNATQLSLGGYFSCALLATGVVRCWGSTTFQQTPVTDRLVPETITGLPPVSNVSAGAYHVCATINEGGVMCWGGFASVEPGVKTAERPIAIRGTRFVRALSAGTIFTCAAVSDGGVRCWGDNTFGQFGNGTNRSSSAAIESFLRT